MELVTSYRFDERLGLMLPIVFRELYEQGKAAKRGQAPARAWSMSRLPARRNTRISGGSKSSRIRYACASPERR